MNQIVSNTSYLALVKEYQQWLQTLGFSNLVVYKYPRYIAYFLQHLEQQGIFKITQLKQKNVQHYFTYLEQRPNKRNPNQTLSTSHLNTNFIAIDKFLEFLHQMGTPNTPPPTKYLIEHQAKKEIQVLTKQEIQQLYSTIPATYLTFPFADKTYRQAILKVVIDLCYGCGMRRSEALNLNIKDVNFDAKIIHIRQGKNYKDRYVPMSKQVYENIQTFVYQHRIHSTNPKRKEKLYPNYRIEEAIILLLKHCENTTLKAKKPTLHTLRHSIATHLLQNGMSIENISTFLGHSSLVSTQLYTHLLNEECKIDNE